MESNKESVANGPALQLIAHKEYSYVPRTGENAQGADVTVAFAVDFTTAGERLTKRLAMPRYIGVPYGIEVETAAAMLSEFMRKHGASSLNVAGNGIYTMAEHGFNQAQANRWVYEVLALVHAMTPLSAIRSGGQTGIDQAGLVAAIALRIPALGLYPKGFRRRLADGKDVTAPRDAVQAELMAQASDLTAFERVFHPDGTLPTDGEIFVFGSNLAGRHGKGSALTAREQFGAIYGQGEGLQGQSYGIPTKDGRPGTPPLADPAATLSLEDVKAGIERFLEFARSRPDLKFFVVRVGCSLAVHKDEDIAPLFAKAPANCSFPDTWKPWLTAIPPQEDVITADPINIWSGAAGLGGALTNMSERAREKGCIKHSYPVVINDVRYVDSEAAYQALKIPGNDEYNDGLMIDIIALKFRQNPRLMEYVGKRGGAAWLEKCSHFTQAKSERFQAWEGQGNGSRFIRNLVFGYKKAVTGLGPKTRVVHVEHAPYDVYIGRDMTAKNPKYVNQGLGNTAKSREVGSVDAAVRMFSELIETDPALKLRAKAVKGRTIGCWCKSRDNYDALCHGDVIAAVADGRPWVPQTAVQSELF